MVPLLKLAVLVAGLLLWSIEAWATSGPGLELPPPSSAEDIIIYTEAIRRWTLSEYWGLALSAQWSDQRSVEDDALTESSFQTGQVGASADVSYRNAVFTTAFTTAENDRDINYDIPVL